MRLLGPSARATLTLFELGAGDAFVTYEQDALLAQERGVPLEIVVPPRTIVAQHVAVIVDDNVTSAERPVAQAFVDYLLSDAGQQTLRRYHLRPAEPDSDAFPKLDQAFTVEDLGGWTQAYTRVGRGFVAGRRSNRASTWNRPPGCWAQESDDARDRTIRT